MYLLPNNTCCINEMTLYLHPNSQKSLAKAYQSAFARANEIFVLSAYLTNWTDFDVSKQCKSATVIVGKDFGITRKKALEDLVRWRSGDTKQRHVYVAHEIDGFHPKIAVWRQGDDHFLIIGSSNLTIAAFEHNYEANIRVRISQERYEEITNWIADLMRRTTALDLNWIELYREANVQARRPSVERRASRVVTSSDVPIVSLPRFPGLATALAQRKERVEAFRAYRKRLISAVKDCASGTMPENVFYQWLLENWNGSEWKLQGNGVFRQRKGSTDWQALCEALRRCLEASDSDRDVVVEKEFDRLEQHERARQRRAFMTEMLCHLFPEQYALWNKPVSIWLQKAGAMKDRPKGLTVGEEYIWLVKALRQALATEPSYPARTLAELDHIIWAFCSHKGWI